MEVTTIACPPGFTDPYVDSQTAPIWVDAKGVEYKIASGPLSGYETSDPIKARIDRVNIVVGVDGLQALSLMGLVPAINEE